MKTYYAMCFFVFNIHNYPPKGKERDAQGLKIIMLKTIIYYTFIKIVFGFLCIIIFLFKVDYNSLTLQPTNRQTIQSLRLVNLN